MSREFEEHKSWLDMQVEQQMRQVDAYLAERPQPPQTVAEWAQEVGARADELDGHAQMEEAYIQFSIASRLYASAGQQDLADNHREASVNALAVVEQQIEAQQSYYPELEHEQEISR